ncbi:MAG: ethanolamine ammonia-lyase light chain EutC, partial [Clostridia bacterium]|nr:ethanolamine ammonia-lyase light chain EutC [Clostridia bacterium]
RVGAGDAIGDLTGCQVVCMLVGERPGLVTDKSMSAYITYKPTVIPSDANFLLFRTERENLADVLEEEYDLVVRRAGTFPGLDAHWVRVAVRTREDDRKLMTALKEVLAHG